MVLQYWWVCDLRGHRPDPRSGSDHYEEHIRLTQREVQGYRYSRSMSLPMVFRRTFQALH